MGLDFGINSHRGLLDACPGVYFYPVYHESGYVNMCRFFGNPEKDQIFIIAIASGVITDERIFLQTLNGECFDCKLNCRENLTMSVDPVYLHINKREEDSVGDVAIIKFTELCRGSLSVPRNYIAVCERLVLRKFLRSFMGV